MRTLQIYSCGECLHRFTHTAGKNKTYPLNLILAAVSIFNLGYSVTDTQAQLQKRFHRSVPERTISSWIAEYKPQMTYARLRASAKKLFAPESIVRTINFPRISKTIFQINSSNRPSTAPPRFRRNSTACYAQGESRDAHGSSCPSDRLRL